MKKLLLVFTSLMLTQIAMSKNITIVIRGTNPPDKTNTEVTSHSNGVTDTLVVSPSKKATAIYVYLKDTNENVYQSYCVPATCNDILSVISPSLPTGLMLEIRDDKGYIYREFD